MTRRTASQSVLPEPPSFPGMMVTAWSMLATVGILGLAWTPPSPGIAPDRVGPSAVRTAFTPTASSGSLVAALDIPTQPAIPTSRAQPASSASSTSDAANRVVVALRAALAQIGLPYVWGGNGPSDGDAGFDCSGLTHFAYAAAGIALPRTAHTQFYAGPHVPTDAPLQPGDLVFYGAPTFVHHVGMYIGEGRMVNAPTFGEPVQIAFYRWSGDDYIGATRPDGSSATGLLTLPFIPEAQGPSPVFPSIRKSDVFAAPRAPVPTVLPALNAVEVPQAQSAAAAVSEERQIGAAALPTPTDVPTPTTNPTPLVASASTATATPSPTPTSDPTTTTGSSASNSTASTAAVPTTVLPTPATAPTKKVPATKAAPIVTTTPPTRTKRAPPSSTTTTAASPVPTTSDTGESSAPTTTTTPTPTPDGS